MAFFTAKNTLAARKNGGSAQSQRMREWRGKRRLTADGFGRVDGFRVRSVR
jgi:hypothetical protein